MTVEDIQSSNQEIIKTIIDHTGSDLCCFSGRFEFINPAFERLTGYKKEEIYSRNFNFLRLVHLMTGIFFQRRPFFFQTKPAWRKRTGGVQVD